LSKFIDNEKEMLQGTENVSEEKSGDKEEAREQAKDCKIIEDDMDGNKEDVTEEKESGSNQQRDQVDHDYEADTRTDVSTESGSSVEGRDTTTSKSGSSSSTSVTTEKESSPGTSLRLVSLSNLVPNSPPPPSEPKRNPTPSWTVAEGCPPVPEPSPPLRASDVAPDTLIPQGTVTPVAPGTKIVSSNVVRLSTDKTGVPAGVYMLVRHNGSKAVLIVKAEPSEATVRVFSDKQASTSLRTFTSANPMSTAVRTVLPKIIKPVQFVIKPSNQEVSSSSGLTCYGTTKASGTKTLRRVVPQPQKYQTPLQLFAADIAPSTGASPQLLDRSVLERWQKMTEAEKDVYRLHL